MPKQVTIGQKIAKTNMERYGQDYYSVIGKVGGRNKNRKPQQTRIFVKFAKPEIQTIPVRKKLLHKMSRIFAS